jgi:hypothetical protein
MDFSFVIPAKAGTQSPIKVSFCFRFWVPAYAGMTGV